MFYLTVTVIQDSTLPLHLDPPLQGCQHDSQLQISEFRQQHLHYISEFANEQNRTLHMYDMLVSTSFIIHPCHAFL